jgi:hypothetical protein
MTCFGRGFSQQTPPSIEPQRIRRRRLSAQALAEVEGFDTQARFGLLRSPLSLGAF